MRQLYIITLFFTLACLSSVAQQTITYGQGNTGSITVSSGSNSTSAINTLLRDGFLPNLSSASRFLSQATLGHNLTNIQEVAEIGIENWLDAQLNMPSSFSNVAFIQSLHQRIIDSLNLTNTTGEPYTIYNVTLSDWHFDIGWFQGAMTAPDLLRWRVAMALSEILVTSRISDFDNNPYALSSYYDILLKNSFGNYRSLLDSITYSPTMAVYLTYMNNHATANVNGAMVFPDENYAREIMQLFSIGLYQLNPNGTEIKDSNGQPLPTYNNNDIAGLAKVFTGLSWHDSQYLGDRMNFEQDYTKRLKFFPLDSSDAILRPWRTNPTITNGHEPGGKTFLGTTIGAGRTPQQGEADIQDALNVIFNHPNVGPFLARRLIQRLVSSNPSPAYIARVAAKFANNGAGIRGDMKAVIKAILLDPEARECNPQSIASTGMLREPFVRYLNLMKGAQLSSPTNTYRNVMNYVYEQTNQRPLNANTVFNFFSPDYIPDGPLKNQGKYGPEFQLLNSQTLTGYLNGLSNWLVNDNPIQYWGYFGNETYKPEEEPGFNFEADYPLASNKNLPQLLDKYNLILAHGSLSQKNLNTIRYAIENMPYANEYNNEPNEDYIDRRIRLAIFLIMSSPDYLINR